MDNQEITRVELGKVNKSDDSVQEEQLAKTTQSTSSNDVSIANCVIEDSPLKIGTSSLDSSSKLQNVPFWLNPDNQSLSGSLYEKIWNIVKSPLAPSSDINQPCNRLTDSALVSTLLITSGLTTEMLGFIWSLANYTVPGALTQHELYIVLALVSLAQSECTFNDLAILDNIPELPIPKLDLSVITSLTENDITGSLDVDVKRKRRSGAESKRMLQEKLALKGIAWDPNRYNRRNRNRRSNTTAEETAVSGSTNDNSSNGSASTLNNGDFQEPEKNMVNLARLDSCEHKKDLQSSLKIAIIHQNSGFNEITDEQSRLIKQALAKEFKILERGEFEQFISCHMAAGGLVMTCANVEIKDWITETVPKLKPWEGATFNDLAVINEISEPLIPKLESSVPTRFETSLPRNDGTEALNVDFERKFTGADRKRKLEVEFCEPRKKKKKLNRPSPVRISIAHHNSSYNKITDDQSKLIREALSNEFKMVDNEEFDQFYSSHLQGGGLIMFCANVEIKIWIEQTVPKLKPWLGANLQTQDAMTKVTFKTPSNYRFTIPSKVLEILGNQNNILLTWKWKVTKNWQCPSGQTLEVFIDDTSLDALKSQGMTAFLGMGKTTFRVN